MACKGTYKQKEVDLAEKKNYENGDWLKCITKYSRRLKNLTT